MDETADFPLVNRNAQLVTEVIVCIHCRDGISLRGKVSGKRLHGGSVDILRELAAKLRCVGQFDLAESTEVPVNLLLPGDGENRLVAISKDRAVLIHSRRQ